MWLAFSNEYGCASNSGLNMVEDKLVVVSNTTMLSDQSIFIVNEFRRLASNHPTTHFLGL